MTDDYRKTWQRIATNLMHATMDLRKVGDIWQQTQPLYPDDLDRGYITDAWAHLAQFMQQELNNAINNARKEKDADDDAN